MKKDIHPKYNAQTSVTCSCGAVFVAGGTKEDMTIETCSQCHPIYTGKQKNIDATGRVERFKKLAAKTEKAKQTRKAAKVKVEKKEKKSPAKKKATAKA